MNNVNAEPFRWQWQRWGVAQIGHKPPVVGDPVGGATKFYIGKYLADITRIR
jgi:hypothetical protein